MENRIALALRCMLTYIVYLIEPGLTLVAAALLLPWLTDEVDVHLVRILRFVLIKLHCTDILRLRLIVAMMFWPTIFKSLSATILWVLLSSQGYALESRFILVFLLYTLLISAALVFQPLVTTLDRSIPVIHCDKEAGYRFFHGSHMLFLPVIAMWLWFETGDAVGTIAIIVSAFYNGARYLGLNIPLQLLYLSTTALLMLTYLDPNGSDLLWILLVFSGVLAFTYRDISQTFYRNFREYKVVRFLKSDQTMDELKTTRDQDRTGC